jgi:hypothetical protein
MGENVDNQDEWGGEGIRSLGRVDSRKSPKGRRCDVYGALWGGRDKLEG